MTAVMLGGKGEGQAVGDKDWEVAEKTYHVHNPGE